jgi:hypothetical protein
VQNGNCILVADDQDVESEVVVELLDPTHGQMGNCILLEVKTFQALCVVLHEDTLALGLS